MGRSCFIVVLLGALLSGCVGPQTPAAPTPTPNSAQAALGPGGAVRGYAAALLPDWIISRDGGWFIDTASLFEGMTSVGIINDLTHISKTLDGDAAQQAIAAMGDVRLTSFRGRVVEPKAGFEWSIYYQRGKRGIRFDTYGIILSLGGEEYEFFADDGTLRAVSARLQDICGGPWVQMNDGGYESIDLPALLGKEPWTLSVAGQQDTLSSKGREHMTQTFADARLTPPPGEQPAQTSPAPGEGDWSLEGPGGRLWMMGNVLRARENHTEDLRWWYVTTELTVDWSKSR